jgi:hypothetical protein
VRPCGRDGTCHPPCPTPENRGRRVMVLVPCYSPLVTRHCLSNRYTSIIEIAATTTKQTVGTQANRYYLSIRPGLTVCTWPARRGGQTLCPKMPIDIPSRATRAEGSLALPLARRSVPREGGSPLTNFAPSSPQAQNSNNRNAIRNRCK